MLFIDFQSSGSPFEQLARLLKPRMNANERQYVFNSRSFASIRGWRNEIESDEERGRGAKPGGGSGDGVAKNEGGRWNNLTYTGGDDIIPSGMKIPNNDKAHFKEIQAFS